MSNIKCVTGIKPTGIPHLGNYLGMIKPALELMNNDHYDNYYFIADYHSINTIHDGKLLNEMIYQVAATFLALGLDTDKCYFYCQSDIPEVTELNTIISGFTSKGLLNRAHAYKAKVSENIEKGKDPDYGINLGLYNYPVLMAADILITDATIVPVGEDQVQHIEIARDIANSFNSKYKKDVLVLPSPKIKESVGLIKGLDGRKMSKSYNNSIPIFCPEKKLKKIINKITTDSLPPEAPKSTKDSIIYYYFEKMAPKDHAADFKVRFEKGMSYGEAKAELFEVVNSYFLESREKFFEYMNDTSKLDEVLIQGANRARPHFQKVLNRVKETIGCLRS